MIVDVGENRIDTDEATSRIDGDILMMRESRDAVHYYGEEKNRFADDLEAILDEVCRLSVLAKNKDVDVEGYINILNFESDTDDYAKSLITGNIRGFASYLESLNIIRIV